MSVVPRATPMLQQYFEAKARAGDALLLYRMGDFYELFFEDARVAAPILGLTLTSRHKDSDIEAPMCGVPHHAVEGYISQLIAAGFRVAVCDQVEDARKARGLVKREITRIVTPGTVLEPDALSPAQPRYLASVAREGESVGVAFLDLSSGDFRAGEVPEEMLRDLFGAYSPAEVLAAEGDAVLSLGIPATPRPRASFSARPGEQKLREAFHVAAVEALGFEPGDPSLGAAWAALEYVRENRRSETLHVEPPRPLAPGRFMRLDASTLAHLEVFESADPHARTTLQSVLDCCSTAMGSRALRETLARPLLDSDEIEARLDAVGEFLEHAAERGAIRVRLSVVGDLARKVSRVAVRSAGPREITGLSVSLAQVPALLAGFDPFQSQLIRSLRQEAPSCADIEEQIRKTLAEEPPAVLSSGGAIRDEADAELAQLRELKRDAHGALARFEAGEKARTGIPTLKVRYNRVFGYYIEISRGQKEKAPGDYVRRQTLANAERFTTPELASLESRILGAEERMLEIEARIFGELQEYLAREAARLAALARVLARLDLFAAMAEVASRRDYSRPTISEEPGIRIVEGRHPVVEAARPGEPFIPNDLDLNRETSIIILTGPNMGGKSTYLRQTALITLMARAGMFVPAREAVIGPVDRIFTRVGAADHLASGQSTFMVEMIEAASILRNATPRSLVILDEVGRGTSTFDGLSIAWAMVEHLHNDPARRALTLFATHYHEMTELSKTLPGVVNFTMAVREWEGKVVFLRKVVAGGADRSYGIHVAELAGLPAPVIARAREILANLEEQELDPRGLPRFARSENQSVGGGQLALFAGSEELVLEKLRSLDVDLLTPVAALSLLATLQERLKK